MTTFYSTREFATRFFKDFPGSEYVSIYFNVESTKPVMTDFGEQIEFEPFFIGSEIKDLTHKDIDNKYGDIRIRFVPSVTRKLAESGFMCLTVEPVVPETKSVDTVKQPKKSDEDEDEVTYVWRLMKYITERVYIDYAKYIEEEKDNSLYFDHEVTFAVARSPTIPLPEPHITDAKRAFEEELQKTLSQLED